MSDKDEDKDKLPPSPITALAEGMAQARETYESMKAAGFTDWQACRILGVWFAEAGRQS